jgi:hypothetical protein
LSHLLNVDIDTPNISDASPIVINLFILNIIVWV